MIKKIICIICFVIVLTTCVYATERQDRITQVINNLIDFGIAEDHPIIYDLQTVLLYDTEDVKILANTVWYESQSCSNRHQQLVAQVVMNRVIRNDFPNSIKEVIVAPRQYQKFYVNNLPCYFESSEEMKRCFHNAVKAYRGEVDCPANVVFQSNNPNLGIGNYETIKFESPWFKSVTYFNYG